MILNAVVPAVSASTFASVINIAFLLLGFVALDKSFGRRGGRCLFYQSFPQTARG